MEDIDLFIKKCKDYIENCVYPEILKPKYVKPIYFPELHPSKVIELKEDSLKENKFIISNSFKKLNQLEKELQILIEKENCTNDDSCPICLNVFNPTGYYMPDCGHKICLSCFTRNLLTNHSSGKLCCLCRENIIPDI
jgi:hypothetical protein